MQSPGTQGATGQKQRAPSRNNGADCWNVGGELGLGGLGRLNQHITAGAPFVDELDGAGDLGKQSVVFAAANVGAGLDAGAALADDDGAAGNKLAAESFYAKPLCVGVAPVSGTA